MTFTFTQEQVREEWGEEGVEIIDELMTRNGSEKLPDPFNEEGLPEYLKRCAQQGLCHVVSDYKHNLQDARAYLAAKDKELPVYEIDGPADEPTSWRNDTLPPEYKDLSPTERHALYVRNKNTLQGHVVTEGEE